MSKTQKITIGLWITTIVVILCMRVWPFEQVQNPCTNAALQNVEKTESGMLSATDAIGQFFVMQAKTLRSITVYMNCDQVSAEDQVYAILYDENKEVIYETIVPVKKIAKKGKFVMKPDCEVLNGHLYELEFYLEGNGNSIVTLQMAKTDALKLHEFSLIGVIREDIVTKESIVADFTYLAPCTPLRMIFICGLYVIGGIAAMVLLLYLDKLYEKQDEIRRKQIGFVAKVVISGLAAFLAVYALIEAVVKNVFGEAVEDRVVFAIGILVVVFFVEIWIWKKGTKKEIRESEETNSKKDALSIVMDACQVIAIAFLFHSAVSYQNAVSMAPQSESLRWIEIFLGVILLLHQVENTIRYGIQIVLSCKKKDSQRKTHRRQIFFFAGYLIVFVALFVFLVYDSIGYCNSLKGDEVQYALAKLTKTRDIIWAVAILHTVAFFRLRILKKIQPVVMLLWAAFALLLWFHRFEYSYLLGIPVFFSLMMLQDDSFHDMKRLAENMVNGMVLAFFLNLYLSLRYRPYQRWMFYRYPMYFHTVACTGEFLVAAKVAVVVKFLMKVRKRSFLEGIPELILTGIVFSYEMLSMARTALMATAGILLILLFVSLCVDRVTWKETGKRFFAVCFSLLLMFPTVFTATRVLPALTNDPYRFPIFFEEENQYGIVKGDSIDDPDYMDILRYVYCLSERFPFPSGIKNWINETYDKSVVLSDKSLMTAQAAVSDNGAAGMAFTPVVLTANLSDKDAEDYDASNGRIEIFKTYLERLDAKGHEELSITLPNETVLVHAHNSFIQVAYSHGIPTGIAFIALIIGTGLLSVVGLLKNKEGDQGVAFVNLTALCTITAFTIASITEWLSTMTIPLSLMFWISIVCLSRRKPE